MIKFFTITKRFFLFVLALIVLVVIFRGWLYRNTVSYESISKRSSCLVNSAKLIKLIEVESKDKLEADIDDIVKMSLSITSDKLNFSFGNTSKDPDVLMDSHSANCIGYSCFFTGVCNYLLKKYNLENSWNIEAHVGHIYFFNMNVHNFFNDPFFLDHDFVVIKNIITEKKIAVDPSLNDYFWINYITIK
jgi:hypothetical protein